MYIKFCRNDQDKKSSDEAGKTLSSKCKLAVDLNGQGNNTQDNVRMYRAVCMFLSLIILVLLLVIIVLCMKIGKPVCSEQGSNWTGRQDTDDGIMVIQTPDNDCQGVCAKGWMHFDDSCFYLSRSRLNWDQSRANCSARGGDLAVVNNQKLQDFLTTKGAVMYWIGLKYRGSKWTWVNSDALADSYWTDNGKEGDCGVLQGGVPADKNWKKGDCSSYTYFICQRPV